MGADRKVVVLGFSLVAWISIALWLKIYEKLEAGSTGVVLRESARQCVYGAISIALEGELITNLSAEALKEKLLALLQPEGADNGRWFWRRETVRTPRDETKVPTTSGEGK
jgi:hypothetical protein